MKRNTWNFMQDNFKLIIGFGFICLALTGLFSFSSINQSRTGFILLEEVYKGFDLKLELERKFVLTQKARKKLLDSMELDLKFLENRVRDQHLNDEEVLELNKRKELFWIKKNQTEEDNLALSRQYDKQILTQLNQYVKDFGQENSYSYIYGNDGNGNLMYGADGKNITQEIINYINKRYKGSL